MRCTKCGAQIPDGSSFCGSCGTTTGTGDHNAQNQVSRWWASAAAVVGRDPVVVVVGIGAFLLCLGSFLPWTQDFEVAGFMYRDRVLGLQMTGGPVVLALGAMLAMVLVLSRGGTPGAWSIVMLSLSAVCLIIVFQTMIYLDDQGVSSGAGVYVAMVGGFATAGGGLLEIMRLLRK